MASTININLNHQMGYKTPTKGYFVGSLIAFGIAVIFAVLSLLKLISAWVFAPYWLFLAMSFYLQSKEKGIQDLFGKSFISWDEQEFKYKPAILKRKIFRFNWNDVTNVDVKLFEVIVGVNGRIELINLEQLSDANRKIVRERFKQLAAEVNNRNIVASG